MFGNLLPDFETLDAKTASSPEEDSPMFALQKEGLSILDHSDPCSRSVRGHDVQVDRYQIADDSFCCRSDRVLVGRIFVESTV